MGGSAAIRTSPKSLGMVRSSILPDFKSFASKFDIDPVDLGNQAGISRQYFEDSELTLPVTAVVQLLELAASKSGISDLGLRLAEARGLPDMGPVNLAIREETTVRNALQALIKLIHFHSDAACLSLDEGDDGALLTTTIMGCGDIAHRQAIDVSVAQLTNVIRWLLDEHWAPVRIRFTHSEPSSSERYRRFFRCPVDFLHENNGILIARADLGRKIHGASPMLRRQVERYLQTLGSPLDRFDRQVARLITQGLPKGEASIEEVARRLGTTTRTLHRKLASFGQNFSAILDDTRKDLAAHYLNDTARSLSRVADLLGFSSPGAFSTWFRRSFGCAPRVWRREQSTPASNRLQ